jgi:hypothetical protein
MLEYASRFLAGGLTVVAFAALGDMVRPKSFAGQFGAAPSIAPEGARHIMGNSNRRF